MPYTGLGNSVSREFFSARMGCQVYWTVRWSLTSRRLGVNRLAAGDSASAPGSASAAWTTPEVDPNPSFHVAASPRAVTVASRSDALPTVNF